MSSPNKIRKWSGRLLKIFAWVVGVLLFLLILIVVLIRTEPVQNYLIDKATHYVSNRTHTRVEIGRIKISFPKKVVIENIFLDDKAKDTLLFAKSISVDIDMIALFSNKISVSEIEIDNLYANIYNSKSDSLFNYDFLQKAFMQDTGVKVTDTTTKPMEFSIGNVQLTQIRYSLNNRYKGTDMYGRIGELKLDFEKFNLEKQIFHTNEVSLSESYLVMNASKSEEQKGDDTTALKLPDIQFKKLLLAHINVSISNSATSNAMKFEIGRCELSPDKISLPTSEIGIASLLVTDTRVNIQTSKDTATNDSSEPIPWKIKADELKLQNIDFVMNASNIPVKEGFDANHIGVRSLSFSAANINFSAGGTSATIDNLSFAERCGFTLTKLSTKFAFDKKHIILDNLSLITPNTNLGNKLSIAYSSLSTIADSLSKLKVDVNLKNSRIGLKDILYFQPDLAKQPVFAHAKSIQLDCSLKGTIGDLKIPRLKIDYGTQTQLIASGNIRGLPDAKNAFYDIEISSFKTTKNEIAFLIPDSSMKYIPADIKVNAKIKGSTERANADVEIRTTLGNFNVSLRMKDETENYHAEISGDGVDLRTLLGDTTFGKLSFDSDIDGYSFDIKKAFADVHLNVSSFQFNKYEYKGLNIDAHVAEKLFDGKINLNDSNLAFDFDGLIDIHKENEVFKFNLDLKGADLAKLNFSKEDLRLSAKASADLKGSSMNTFNGEAGITNLIVVKDEKTYGIDSVLFASVNEKGKSSFKFSSSILTARFDGTIVPGDAGLVLSHQFNRYFDIGDTSAEIPAAQNFTFEVKVQNHPLLSEVLMPGLMEFEPVSIKGEMNSEQSLFKLEADIPRIAYSGLNIKAFHGEIKSDPQKIDAQFTLDEVSNETIRLSKTTLTSTVQNDEAVIRLVIADSTSEKLVLNSKIISLRQKDYRFQIIPNGLVIDKQVWTIPQDNFIRFGKNGLLFNEFNLTSDQQSLSIHSPSQSVAGEINFDFKNFKLESFSKIVEKDSSLVAGTLTGYVHLNEKGDAGFTADLNIKALKLRNIPVADLDISARQSGGNSYEGKLKMYGEGNELNASANFTGGDKPAIDGNVEIRSLTMKSLSAFSNGQLTNASGTVSGEIKVQGELPKPDITGELQFHDAAFHSSFANNYFTLKNEKLRFDNKGVYFSNFTLIDSTGNQAVLNGNVYAEDFKINKYDLRLILDNFTLLNTEYTKDELFFGKLILNSNTQITGTAAMPQIYSKTKLRSESQFTVMVPESKVTNDRGDGIVLFVDTKQKLNPILTREKETEITKAEIKGYTINADLEIDKTSVLKIVIDPVAGDSLVIRGDGNLSFTMDPSGKTSLTGLYTVSEGSYRLSFHDLLHKEFVIQKGSTINWNGDPLDAQINIDAVYERKASPADLVAGQLTGLSETEQNKYKQNLPFLVILHIKGEMLKPEITFQIDLPEKYRSAMGGTVYAKLNQLNSDPSELNKQVFALLFLGRFIQEDPLASSGGNAGIETVAKSSVSKILSQQLNKLSGQYVKGVELEFDLQSFEDYSTGSAEEKTQLEVGLKKQLFNERVSVQVGSMVDLSDNPNNSSSELASDVIVEYKITENGRYRLKVFRQNQYEDILDGPINVTGVGVVYTRDFDYWKNLFNDDEEENEDVIVPYKID